METVDVLIKMPKIEGYAYTGEFRVPVEGEYYMDIYGKVYGPVGMGCYLTRPILRKAEVWKPLTLEKALELGKSGGKHQFRLPSFHCVGVKIVYTDSVDYIDLQPSSKLDIRLANYGWAHHTKIEYLEQ